MKNHFNKVLLFAAAGLLLTAMKDDGKKVKAIDMSNFDKSVRPQDDFYQYVNGNWLKNNPVPSTESRWGTFSLLNEKSLSALKSILEDASTKPQTAKTNMQRVGDFYATGMDSASIEKAGFSPLKEELAKIDNVKSTTDFPSLIAEQHKLQINSAFAFAVFADFKNSSLNVPYLFQAGTNLPEKEYYTSSDPSMQEIRTKYTEHVSKLFQLMGDAKATADKNASAVLSIETKLADSSMSAVEQRDIEAQYNKMKIADLTAICPNFDWNKYFTNIGATGMSEIIVGQPKFMKQFNSMINSVSMDDWKAYFRWQLVHSVAGKLHSAVADENFNFFGRTLSGVAQQQPRWKRVLASTEGALGDALGELYVQRNFSAESKKRVAEMVENLIAAYKERIMSRDWMSDETKTQAIAKLGTILRKLGYTEKWRDYTGLEIKRDSYVQNYWRSNKFDFQWFLGKMNKPVDRGEWTMTPQTINAYYNPTNNEIVFPAAIMQPPFFNADADDAVNYGSMGAIIGHELTHGFDDQGSMFDSEGNLKNWWTDDDRKKFSAKTDMLVQQFNSYQPLANDPSVHVNGALTLGENIADLGGLTISYYAFKKSLEGKAAPAKIDGFTAEQRFFIAWAQGWHENDKPEAIKVLVKTNPHAPTKFRANGPVSNMQEFYDAFGVKPGDKLYRKPEERANIW